MSKSIISQLKLGNRKQEAVYLIEQQLKTRYFFDNLERIGLGSYDAEPNLDHLILKKLNLDDGTDETYARYTEIINEQSRNVASNLSGSVTHAFKTYVMLKKLRKQLKKKSTHDTAGTATPRV